MITVEQAKKLEQGDILHEDGKYSADGKPRRWKVVGSIQTWKTKPDKVSFTMRTGLYSLCRMTQYDLQFMSIPPKERR